MWKATISPEKRKKIRRSVSFFLSLLLILEMVSGTGMFAEGNRVKAKEETPYAVYLDLSGSSTAEALASKGIYAYAYDEKRNRGSDAAAAIVENMQTLADILRNPQPNRNIEDYEE